MESLYLTKIEFPFSPFDRVLQTVDTLRRWQQTPYLLHRKLWDGLPEDVKANHNKQDGQPFLFAIEVDGITPHVLIQTPFNFDWQKVFAEEIEKKICLQPETKEIPVRQIIQKGRTFRFMLTANPTKKVKDFRSAFQEDMAQYPTVATRSNIAAYQEGKKKLNELKKSLDKEKIHKLKSKRVGLYREQEQIAWLERKAQHKGFSLINVMVLRTRIGSHQKSKGQLTDGGPKLLLVTFSGSLCIEDPEKFYHAYCRGIGPAKAFGCGLLLLAPPAL